ncbi:hypothetical protein L3Q72_03420 [Vibrio sp. JC009]|uniref:hypothetical protein n=1 Tax=Vibrio sp. JC009 TaxID=2912314 RepID=UPI0023AEF648|nr:hypothetical protein [Vibrio sp. JC009]WED22466.1 hypothetical protein L3Q72_03420 [Vibrio sp. JC009]
MAVEHESRKAFRKVVEELKAKGTYAGCIEKDPGGEWLGMVYERNLGFSDPEDQLHYAHCVFNGEKRLKHD